MGKQFAVHRSQLAPFHLLAVTQQLPKICFVAVIKFIRRSRTHTPNGSPDSEVLQSPGTKTGFISFQGEYSGGFKSHKHDICL